MVEIFGESLYFWDDDPIDPELRRLDTALDAFWPADDLDDDESEDPEELPEYKALLAQWEARKRVLMAECLRRLECTRLKIARHSARRSGVGSHHEHPIDVAAIHVHDLETPPIERECGAHRGHAGQVFDHELLQRPLATSLRQR